MNEQTFFSVIIPTLDRMKLLKLAIDSVLTQSFDNLELIVVDDGSTDGTFEMLRAYTDPRLRVIHQKNKGVSSARNRGLKISRGDFIAFLDSDDRWLPEKLQKTQDNINAFPHINIFHTEEIWYRQGKLLNQRPKHKKPSGDVYQQALPICCISISTVVVKRTVFDEIGTFDESLEACEDYDLWLRACCRYEVKLIPEHLTLKDGGRPDQLSSRVWGLDRFRITALEKMINSGSLSKNYLNATIKELRKKCEIFAKGADKHGKLAVAEHYRELAKKYN